MKRSEIKIQPQYRILCGMCAGAAYSMLYTQTKQIKIKRKSSSKYSERKTSTTERLQPRGLSALILLEISIYFILTRRPCQRKMCFVCGCVWWMVVHVGKENKIPFLWCSDKDFYAFYFKSKLNHFLLNFLHSTPLQTSILRRTPCGFGRDPHERGKLLNSHYSALFFP